MQPNWTHKNFGPGGILHRLTESLPRQILDAHPGFIRSAFMGFLFRNGIHRNEIKGVSRNSDCEQSLLLIEEILSDPHASVCFFSMVDELENQTALSQCLNQKDPV